MSRIDRALLNQILARTSITNVVGRKVAWDKKKSNPARGDMWGCCPFHGEKTPSFHAVEDKGIYHCFGCGETGNAFDFLMKIDNMSFQDAAETLAKEAGIEIPKSSYQNKEQQNKFVNIQKALETARKLYATMLLKDEGKRARDYLINRGVSQEYWAKFGLGFSPNVKNWLKDKLTAQGFMVDDLVDAGILRRTDDGQVYDYFRNRLMFAIEDGAGKTISFGARTLEKDAQPKYLNGPETKAFSKGYNLYRLKEARANSKNQPIIISEGYMDVLSLEMAGFAAVAPMGTALTNDQLNLAWRACSMPILCFDGDDAGIRAGVRALDRALPFVTPSKSLKFAIMPEGQDPDDIIKSEGRQAMLEILQNAKSLTKFLFETELQEIGTDSAEQKAMLRSRLNSRIEEIKDEYLKSEIKIEVKELLNSALGRDNNFNKSSQFNPKPNFSPNQRNNRPNQFARGGFAPSDELKKLIANEKIVQKRVKMPKRPILEIFGAVISCPKLLEDDAESFVMLQTGHLGLDTLRDAILDSFDKGEAIDFSSLSYHLKLENNINAFEVLEAIRKLPLNPLVKKDLDFDETRKNWLLSIQRQRDIYAVAEGAKIAKAQFQAGEEGAYHLLTKLAAERRRLKSENNGSE